MQWGGVILYIAGHNEGYGIANFILLYFIGRWIALYAKDNSKRQQIFAAITLFLSVVLTFGLVVLWVFKGHSVEDKTVFAYSSPWVIASSVALFLMFKNITINKFWVAYVAPSVFSVYLFHENSLINQIVYIEPLRFVISIIPNDALSYLAMVAYGIILFALIVLFDRFVRLNIQERILNALSNVRVLKIIDSKLLKLNE